MQYRSVEEYVALADKLDATNRSAEKAMADQILADLVGYNRRSRHRDEDMKRLANALIAYARLLQMHGVVA